LNYGVVFEREAKLTLAQEYWLHTYEIALPEHVPFPVMVPCYKDNNTCLLIANVLSQLNAIRLETDARLNNTLKTVNKLVPHASIVRKSRSKRALLPFIGKFSQTLFGTATVDDVNTLGKHINALNKRTRSLANALLQHGEHLSSFMQKSNDRMNNLMDGIKQNNVAIRYITSQLKKSTTTLQQSFEDMTSLLIHQLQISNKLNHELDELKLAVVDLANGNLSPLILPIDIVQSTLNDVQSLLSLKYPGFYVATKSASSLYHNAKFLYTRNNSILYLTLKIPISHMEDPMELFKIISVPVPVNDTSKHATQLLDVPDYFAMSRDQQFYVHLSESQLASCKGSYNKYCHLNLPLVPVTQDSCTLALFANNKESIHALCEFRFLHNAIFPRIMELNPSKILLYDSLVLSMECGTSHSMIHGCKFCIFDVPCKCSISSTHFYLPPRLISCDNGTSRNITKLHPVNLVLLQEFFDNDNYQHIFADSTFLTPLNVSLPKFRIYNHKMSNIIANDVTNHLNLSKMVEVAKNDDIVFQTLAEPILDGQLAIETKWPDFNGILTLCLSVVTAATTCLSLWMFFKLRKLSTTLLILERAQSIKALPTSLPSFIYTHKPSTESQQASFNLTVSWEQVNFALLCINTLCLAIFLIKLIKVRKAPVLLLEVTSLQQCIFVPIMTLPLCPAHVPLNIPTFVSEINITGSYLFPTLEIDWNDITFDNALTTKQYHVPNCVRLSLWQRVKLTQITKQPFYLHLHTEHGGYLSQISTTDDV